MATIEQILATFLVMLLAFIISALPLYFAVKFMGGKTGILKVILVNIITALIVAFITATSNAFGGIIAFILVILIYREFFRLKWLKAIVVWLLQFVFLAVLIFLFGIIGVSIAGIGIIT